MRPSLAGLLALAGAASVVAIGAAVAGAVPAVDTAGMMLANAWQHPALDAAFVTFTWLGSLIVLVPATVAIAWHMTAQKGWQSACFPLAALTATAAFAHVAKLVFERARPDAYAPLVTMPPDASFPSAHAAQATAVALALLFQHKATGHLRIALVTGLVILVSIVASSRVYLQVHFPSDVIAGIVLATSVVLGLLTMPIWRGAAR